jgi:hypothetical protein
MLIQGDPRVFSDLGIFETSCKPEEKVYVDKSLMFYLARGPHVILGDGPGGPEG